MSELAKALSGIAGNVSITKHDDNKFYERRDFSHERWERNFKICSDKAAL